VEPTKRGSYIPYVTVSSSNSVSSDLGVFRLSRHGKCVKHDDVMGITSIRRGTSCSINSQCMHTCMSDTTNYVRSKLRTYRNFSTIYRTVQTRRTSHSRFDVVIIRYGRDDVTNIILVEKTTRDGDSRVLIKRTPLRLVRRVSSSLRRSEYPKRSTAPIGRQSGTRSTEPTSDRRSHGVLVRQFRYGRAS